MIRADYRHHVTVTFVTRASGREETMHVIGTADQVAAKCAQMVKAGLDSGLQGPFTFAPIHPANVWDMDRNP